MLSIYRQCGKIKRYMALLLTVTMGFGLFVAMPASAGPAVAGTPLVSTFGAQTQDSPFTTYTVVDPGNGENGTDVLTWDQIPGSLSSRTLLLTIGDTVNILATTSPTAMTTLDFSGGQFRLKDDIPVGVVNTVTGVAGVTYENVALSVFGDLTVQDLSLSCAYAIPLTFKGVLWHQGYNQARADTYYYHNYPATLSVNGDCRFVSSAPQNYQACIYISLYTVLELTIDGTGTLYTEGRQGILFQYDDYMAGKDTAQKAILTINIPVVAKMTYYGGSYSAALTLGNGSGSAMYRKYEVNGTGSLTAITTNEKGTGANGELAANGIFGFTEELTFSGDLKINAKGFGMGFGLYLLRCRDLVFDLSADAVFEGGDYGSGFFWTDVHDGGTAINLVNKNAGDVVFRGGAINGYGTWFYSTVSTFALSNTGKGRFVFSGGGSGSGVHLVWKTILDISGLNYDLELKGGEIVPTRQTQLAPWGTNVNINGCYMSSAGLLVDQEGCGIILGDNNLLCQGGANGGAGIDLRRAGTFLVESTGGKIYAVGGKGPFGNGLFSGSGENTINGKGTINAYGGYNNTGVHASRINLDSGVTVNALGGAKAPDVSGTIR